MLVCKKKNSEDRMLHFLRLNNRPSFLTKHMQCDK